MFELRKVDKNFPGVRALKAVDLHVDRGEIVGLVGENGAGKSTLMKIMYGAYRHDGGEMLINGRPVVFGNPRQAMDQGVGMVFQEQSLIGNLTVMENIFLGFEKQFVRFGVVDWKKMAKAAEYQLGKVRLTIDPATVTSKLSFAQRQLVELAKVLTLEERISGDLVILLDEPTSVLDKDEVKLLFQIVRDLRSRAGFIFVSHRLDEVIDLSDRIYVMKDGEVVGVVDADVAEMEGIQHKMVGRNINKEYYREDSQKPYDAEKILLQLDEIGHSSKYRRISLKLHAGEVLALVGVEGSGREAILRSIFGLLRPHVGSITVKGKKLYANSAPASVRRGIGYVPRERKVEGIVNGLNIYENMTLSQMPKYSRGGLLRIAEERAQAREWIKKLSIKASSEMVDCGNLSGGNQQKVVLAKWRSGGSDIILLDHPTRGLDIGAKEDVYDMVREMCDAGCGVVLVADTLEEAIGLAHTIAVVKDGEIQEWFQCRPGAKPSLYDLIHHMV